VNEFTWAGFDLEPNVRGEVAYGFLPPRTYDAIREQVLTLARTGRLQRIPR
jgi:hypothetical protein